MSDLRYSSDFEDIIYLFENRVELITEINNTDKFLKEYLKKEIATLLSLPVIEEAVSSNVEQNFIYERTKKILAIWREFVEN